MRFGSVCSGIEAASVAFAPLGWKAAWFSEIEPFPCEVLKHHYPDVPNYGDMTMLPQRILDGEIEAPEMLCGGTPCQAFSVAGQRKSLDDERGNLSLTFCEIANAIDTVRTLHGQQPAIIFWENVPGVLSTRDNALGCFLAELVGSNLPLTTGADGNKWPSAGLVVGPKRQAAWRTLDAQHFGVPQRRRRVFVVASARNDFDPSKVLFESPCVSGNSESSSEARQGTPKGSEECVRGASQGIEDSVFPKRTWGEYRQGLPLGTLKACGDDTGHGGENLVISESVSLGSGKQVTPTVVAGYSKCYNDLKDGGCLAVHTGYREGSFGQFVESELAGTTKASGGVLGGVRDLNNQVVGTLTACDLMKGSTNNQSISNGLLIVDENL